MRTVILQVQLVYVEYRLLLYPGEVMYWSLAVAVSCC